MRNTKSKAKAVENDIKLKTKIKDNREGKRGRKENKNSLIAGEIEQERFKKSKFSFPVNLIPNPTKVSRISGRIRYVFSICPEILDSVGTLN